MNMSLALKIENKYEKIRKTPLGQLILQLKKEDLPQLLTLVDFNFRMVCDEVDSYSDSEFRSKLLRKEMTHFGEVYYFAAITYMRLLNNNL